MAADVDRRASGWPPPLLSRDARKYTRCSYRGSERDQARNRFADSSMDILYKYSTFSRWPLDMLAKRQLYFGTPQQLNDPYDCRISIRRALSEAVEQAIKSTNVKLTETLKQLRDLEGVYERMEADIGSVGVFSMTKRPNNVVMWTHYADNHAGFCAGFQLSNKFTTHLNDYQIIGAAEAHYSTGNPFADYFNEIAALPELPTWDEFWKALLSIGMVAKARAWEYEDEVRVLRKGGGAVPFEPSELIEIIFGMNMPFEQQQELRQLLAGEDWRHVRFSRVVRGEGFAVSIDDAWA